MPILKYNDYNEMENRKNPFIKILNNYFNENYNGYYNFTYDLKSKDYNYILYSTNNINIDLILKLIYKKWNLNLKVVEKKENYYYLDFNIN